MVLPNLLTAALSVSQLNQLIGELVDQLGELKVEGEVSNFTSSAAGHWYFSLKDNAAQVSCALFGAGRIQRQPLHNGDQIIVTAKPSIYKVRGSFQLIVSSFERSGKGAILRQIAERQHRLAQEGLFDEKHKKQLPAYTGCIGVVTSASGAAVTDIVKTCARRSPSTRVLIYPCLVQGDGSADSIIQAIKLADEHAKCDALILGRGGGSLEDLMTYNDEQLIRAVFACTIPIVSAVGHERDFSLCDLVADARASTPTAAAEMLTTDSQVIMQQLDELYHRLKNAIQQRIKTSEWHLQQLQARVIHPIHQLENTAQHIKQLTQRAKAAMQATFARVEWNLRHFEARLVAPVAQIQKVEHTINQLTDRLHEAVMQQIREAEYSVESKQLQLKQLHPTRVLERGFALVSDPEGNLIVNAPDARKKEKLTLTFADDRVQVTPLKYID